MAPPTKLRFLSRNRIIAAVSLGTVVVEAAVRSGALNTASWAELTHRALMGVPGPVTSAPSEGVHELLRSRGAVLVTGGSDVLEMVSPSGAFTQSPRGRPNARPTGSVRQTGRCSTRCPRPRQPRASSVARTAGLAERTVREASGDYAAEASWRRDLPDGGWHRPDTRRPRSRMPRRVPRAP